MSGTRQAPLVARAARSLARSGLGLAARLYRMNHRTLRLYGLMPDGSVIRSYAEYPSRREIVALCERDALALGGFIAGKGYVALVAHGRDGDWASAMLEAIGCRVVRGASGRGGAAAGMELMRWLQTDPSPAAIAIDGPLGPAGDPKPGVILCAQHSARPVRPIAAAVRHALVFEKTWSKLYLPLPFSRLVVAIEDHVVAGGPSKAERESATRLLAERLAQARARAMSFRPDRLP